MIGKYSCECGARFQTIDSLGYHLLNVQCWKEQA